MSEGQTVQFGAHTVVVRPYPIKVCRELAKLLENVQSGSGDYYNSVMDFVAAGLKYTTPAFTREQVDDMTGVDMEQLQTLFAAMCTAAGFKKASGADPLPVTVPAPALTGTAS